MWSPPTKPICRNGPYVRETRGRCGRSTDRPTASCPAREQTGARTQSKRNCPGETNSLRGRTPTEVGRTSSDRTGAGSSDGHARAAHSSPNHRTSNCLTTCRTRTLPESSRRGLFHRSHRRSLRDSIHTVNTRSAVARKSGFPKARLHSAQSAALSRYERVNPRIEFDGLCEFKLTHSEILMMGNSQIGQLWQTGRC